MLRKNKTKHLSKYFIRNDYPSQNKLNIYFT